MSITDFIAEFSSYLENIITTPHKLVIGGNFNIHVEDAGNSDANKFCDLLESMNLRNHVWSSTHVSGHVLDLIITRNNDSIILNSAERRYFISDHAFIRTHTTLIKPKTEVKEIEYRKLKDIDLSQFKEDIRASELMDMKDKSVHEKAIVYDRILRDILDSHAPVVKKIIKIKKGSPWYNLVLPILSDLSRSFQYSTVNFARIAPCIQAAKGKLNSLVKQEWEEESVKACELKTDLDGKLSASELQYQPEFVDPLLTKYVAALIQNIDNRFDDDLVSIMSSYAIFDPRSVPEKDSLSFQTYDEHIKILADHYYPDDRIQINDEWKNLKYEILSWKKV